MRFVVVEDRSQEQILKQIEADKDEGGEEEPRPPIVSIVRQADVRVIRQREHNENADCGLR